MIGIKSYWFAKSVKMDEQYCGVLSDTTFTRPCLANIGLRCLITAVDGIEVNLACNVDNNPPLGDA